MNMTQWLQDIKAAPVKKPMPVLSFPCIQLLGIDVQQLISSSDYQAKGMKAVADRTDAAASVSMMDLSLEAEAFGSTIRVSPDEVPAVIGHIVENQEQADSFSIQFRPPEYKGQFLLDPLKTTRRKSSPGPHSIGIVSLGQPIPVSSRLKQRDYLLSAPRLLLFQIKYCS